MTQSKANLAVLFVDVTDSTRLYDSLGDTQAFGHIRNSLGMFREQVGARGGRVIKTIGDAALCVFDDADAAAFCAADMQRLFELDGTRNPLRLAIRIGIHFGAVIEDGDDIFGDCVNVAARVAALAKAGEIILTGAAAELLQETREWARPLHSVSVRGKAGEIEVFEIVWHLAAARAATMEAADAIAAAYRKPAVAPVSGIRLSFRGRPLEAEGSVLFGRHMDNTVVIRDLRVSRHHATIEPRDGRYFLLDHSRNGTWVATGGAGERRLFNDACELSGVGVIAFGVHTGVGDAPRVLFCHPAEQDRA